jgi:hypothetical protein
LEQLEISFSAIGTSDHNEFSGSSRVDRLNLIARIQL